MSSYPRNADIDMTNFTPRRITNNERELLLYLHGDDAWRVREPWVSVLNGYVSIGPDDQRSCLAADGGRLYVLLHGPDPMALVHEFGHAIHALRYPDSLNTWPVWKCEAWAELSAMRAVRLKVGLTPEMRSRVARHIWATRKQGFEEHKQALKVAWRASRYSDKLSAQQEYIVNAVAP